MFTISTPGEYDYSVCSLQPKGGQYEKHCNENYELILYVCQAKALINFDSVVSSRYVKGLLTSRIGVCEKVQNVQLKH